MFLITISSPYQKCWWIMSWQIVILEPKSLFPMNMISHPFAEKLFKITFLYLCHMLSSLGTIHSDEFRSHLLTHWFTHSSFTSSFIYPFIHSLIHLLLYSFSIHSFTHSSIYLDPLLVSLICCYLSLCVSGSGSLFGTGEMFTLADESDWAWPRCWEEEGVWAEFRTPGLLCL